MAVKFVNNLQVTLSVVDKRTYNLVEEVKDLLASQAASNTKRESGQLSDSFTTDSIMTFKKGEAKAIIGSSVEYAPYYEFGTGEWALYGNGRKGGWVYFDPVKNKFIGTTGQTPKRPLYRAYIIKRASIIQHAREVFNAK